MGFGINELGAALGGVAQGAPQGLDLYAKYGDLAEKNRQRQNQRKIEAKISDMAKTGIFETDHEGAMRQIGDAYAEMGDPDNYAKYIKSADELQKASSQRAGAKVYAASSVSPEETVRHIDDYNRVQKTGGGPAKYTRNPDGSFNFDFGSGTSTAFKNLEDFHKAALRYVAPGTLEPAQWAELESKTNEREANTGLIGAQTGKTGAETGRIGDLLPGEIDLQHTQSAQNRAQVGYLGALGAESGSRTAENVALRPYKVGQAAAGINLTDAQAEGARIGNEFNQQTMGPRIQEARAKGAVAEMDVGAYGPRLQAELEGKKAGTSNLQATTAATKQGTFAAWAMLPGNLSAQQMDLYQKAQEAIASPKTTALKLAQAKASLDALEAETAGRRQQTSVAGVAAPYNLSILQSDAYLKAQEVLNDPKATALKQAQAQATIDQLQAETEGRRQQTSEAGAAAPGKIQGQSLDNAIKSTELLDLPRQQEDKSALTRSNIDYNQGARGQMKATGSKADIASFVVDNSLTGQPTPLEGDPTHLANMRDAVMAGTGSKDGSHAAALGNQALRAVRMALSNPRLKIGFDAGSGDMLLPDGQRLAIGKDAARYLFRLYQEQKGP